MWIINNREIFYGISIALVAASVVSLAIWGLEPGIDFTGGTLVEVAYQDTRPSMDSVIPALSAIDPAVSVRPSGSDEFFVRMKTVDQAGKEAVMNALSMNGTASTTIKSFDSVGPVLGAEALRKAWVSVILVILGIVLYITFAFRKVSKPVSSWKYGLIAVSSLIHDVIIPVGAFSILGHYLGYEVDTLFVTALLVILGFSVHNTIVVFDRVRENIRLTGDREPFSDIVGKSVAQTFTRSMNTSATVVIALVVLLILGSETTAHFTLALIIGIVAGTWSSVFIGSPLLVTIEKWQSKKDKSRLR
ncbi:MAG: protein translocase subunit SecF [Patescibacteria group bacterium]|nr:protein translocase subunit SecF [Patescibacteria group bacterium]